MSLHMLIAVLISNVDTVFTSWMRYSYNKVLCCACKHSRQPRAKKCPMVSESALKIGAFASTAVSFDPPHMFVFLAFST